MNAIPTPPTAARELVINRIIDAAPEKLYRAWTEPALLKQWFAPKPWTTPGAELYVRPGGGNLITMRSPEGQDMPNPGMYLEVVPNKRLVFTDAYTKNWEPKDGNPFMTVILTFEDMGNGKTNYTARVLHWTQEAYDQHVKMGFHQGWGICADQLTALVTTL